MNLDWTPLAPVTTIGGPTSVPSPIDGTMMEVDIPSLTVEEGSSLLMRGLFALLEKNGISQQDALPYLHFNPSTKVRYVDDSQFDGVADAYYDLESGELRIPQSLADAIIALGAEGAASAPTTQPTEQPVRSRRRGPVGDRRGYEHHPRRLDAARAPDEARRGAVDARRSRPRDLPPAAAEQARTAGVTAVSATTATDTDHDLAVALALVIHEAVHGAQHQSGRVDQVLDQARLLLDSGDRGGAIELVARELELPAQRAQEEAQLAMGAIPRTTSWLTLSAGGAPLSDDEATANIVAARSDDILASITGADSELPGRRLPGRRLPGRRLPGEAME